MLGRIDLQKANYLVIDNDCSNFAGKGAEKDKLKFSREYELDITQGNSAECDLLSYTTGIEEESIVWNGERITATIPYATDWSLLKSEYCIQAEQCYRLAHSLACEKYSSHCRIINDIERKIEKLRK